MQGARVGGTHGERVAARISTWPHPKHPVPGCHKCCLNKQARQSHDSHTHNIQDWVGSQNSEYTTHGSDGSNNRAHPAGVILNDIGLKTGLRSAFIATINTDWSRASEAWKKQQRWGDESRDTHSHTHSLYFRFWASVLNESLTTQGWGRHMSIPLLMFTSPF